MLTFTPQEIARAVGGVVQGQQVLAPGPGHSRKDRSLSIRISASSPDGFVVHSHAGDDWRAARDYVAAALGLGQDRHRREHEADPAADERRQEARRREAEREQAEGLRRQRFAIAMWNEAGHPAGTIVEAYLRSRGLDLPDEIAGHVLRFHPRCPWGSGTSPAMVAAIRCIRTDVVLGVHRTALTPKGEKLGRKVFGSATAAAIKLDADEDVASGLVVGEGIETCLAARQIGFVPVWSLISAGNIGALPVLDGIEAVTVLAEIDTPPHRPSAAACEQIGTRWHAAGRSVDIVTPRIGKDMNDVLRGGVAA